MDSNDEVTIEKVGSIYSPKGLMLNKVARPQRVIVIIFALKTRMLSKEDQNKSQQLAKGH